MSDREIASALLDAVPSRKIGYVIAYLQGLTADELDEDFQCRQTYQEYMNDPDRGDLVSLDEALKECGVSPDEL